MKTSSGVPNTTGASLPVCAFGPGISVCSWNARGLYHSNKPLRDNKAREILKLCRDFDIVGVLETHGCMVSLPTTLAACLRSHELLMSHVRDINGNINFAAGGTCLLVAKRLFASLPPPDDCFQVLHHGRAVKLTLKTPVVCSANSVPGTVKTLSIFLVHNFGFTSSSTSALIKQIDETKSHCKMFPNEQSMILIGDFNLSPIGSVMVSLLDSSSLSNTFVNLVPPRPFQSLWNKLFEDLLEIDFPLPSHINSASLTLSRIHRIFFPFQDHLSTS